MPEKRRTIPLEIMAHQEESQVVATLVSQNLKTATNFKISSNDLNISVGRNDCTVNLSDPRVSSQHFQIIGTKTHSEVSFSIIDVSSNGTVLNDKKLSSHMATELADGDVIVVLPGDIVGEEDALSYVFSLQDDKSQTASTESPATSSSKPTVAPSLEPANLPNITGATASRSPTGSQSSPKTEARYADTQITGSPKRRVMPATFLSASEVEKDLETVRKGKQAK
eukprot:Platyproteum_vivax@DN10239_c0_g1_i1.p1